MAPSSTNKLLFDVKTEAIELVCKHIGRTTSHTDIGARHIIENAASSRVVKIHADGLQSRRDETWLPQPAIAGLIAHRCIVIKVTAQSPAPDIIEPHNPLPEHKVYDRARHFSCIRLTRPVVGPNHEDNGCAGLWASSVFERGSDKASRVRVEVMSLKAYEDSAYSRGGNKLQFGEPHFGRIVELSLTGMMALAHHGYTLTDGKPDNILLSKDGGYLTDFCNCVVNFKQPVTGPILCSDGYTPPEIATRMRGKTSAAAAWIDHCRTGQPARSMVFTWGVSLCVPLSSILH